MVSKTFVVRFYLKKPKNYSKGTVPIYLRISIIQGLTIAAGVLGLYCHFMEDGYPFKKMAITFTTLVLSNIFLPFINRSFYRNIF